MSNSLVFLSNGLYSLDKTVMINCLLTGGNANYILSITWRKKTLMIDCLLFGGNVIIKRLLTGGNANNKLSTHWRKH